MLVMYLIFLAAFCCNYLIIFSILIGEFIGHWLFLDEPIPMFFT
ncbi:unnamed protein product [Enterobius vermicularis]|uniref:Copper transporter n=1 Tax=Enterobius vermicularis TaxID=51028 RepID=A0A0N4V1U2_ENTVE|nr:unnamed protein product [Enterobius vermicularis]